MYSVVPDDDELKLMRIVKRLLDRFLAKELALRSDADDAAETSWQAMLKQAIENHAYDKWRV